MGWQECSSKPANTGNHAHNYTHIIFSLSTPPHRPEDERHPTVKPDRVVDNLAHAVDLLLNVS